jgi:hypothetical protein
VPGGRSARPNLTAGRDYYAEGVDRLIRLREPATAVVLVGLAVHLGLTLAYFLLAPEFENLPLVDLALSLGSPVLVALLAVLVTTCWMAEATPRARGLTVLSLVLTAGLLVTATGLLVAGLMQGFDVGAGLFSVFRGFVPWLATAVIAVGVFVTLLRRPSAAVTPTAADAVETVAEPEAVPAPPPDPQLQPGWSPDAAVGAVWRRAGDAAAGAPATRWDATGQPADWWGPGSATDAPPEGDWSAPGRG